MALVLSEEQSMLRDSARGLISDKAPVSHLRQLRDTKDATGFSRDLWKSFAEMGFSGLLVPEDFGGSGLGCVEAGVVMEEIGRTLMPSPFLATAVLAASALSRGGSAAQKAEHLPRIADGSLLAALAIDEGAKHRPLQTKLQAVRSGNGFKLSGDKAFVVDGHTADLLIVAASTGGAPGRRGGRGRESRRRLNRGARGSGRRADAWRHGHDRPVRHRLLHEAGAGLPGIVRRHEFSRRSTGTDEELLKCCARPCVTFHSSSPAKAGEPVRRGRCVLRRTLRSTGSPGQAGR